MVMEININATTAKLINAEKILNGCVKIVDCKEKDCFLIYLLYSKTFVGHL